MSRNAIVVVGAQWGDEGKGKIVDVLAEDVDAVARFNGGPNAGHTLVIDGETNVIHQLPVGIVRQSKKNFVGPYVVCDPAVIVQELQISNRANSFVMIDPRAPIILPIHKTIDAGREASSGARKVGTTGRGIGPCYEDFVSRRGPVLGDLTSRERFEQALMNGGYYAEREAVARSHGMQPITLGETLDWGMRFAEEILPRLGDTLSEIQQLLDEDGSVLFEGAQGILLDIVHGQRPFCTSSSCGIGAVSTTMGVHTFSKVIGVAKAYVTRVGNGPFPTEFDEAEAKILREKGGEYGATTGRDRRCGYLDIPALYYACRRGGITELALTKLDILTGFPKIKVCTDYIYKGRSMDPSMSLTTEVLTGVKPAVVELDGWTEDLRACRYFEDLPPNARTYIEFIEAEAQTSITLIGTGPDRTDLIQR